MEGFSYYSISDQMQTMGYRDSVDSAKMEIEGSSFILSASNADSTNHFFGAKEREES